MTMIKIAAQVGNGKLLSTGGIYNGDPPVTGRPNLLDSTKTDGPDWSKELVAGKFTFQIDAAGEKGSELTVTITGADSAKPKTTTVTLDGPEPEVVRMLKSFPFTVGADGSVS